MEMHPKKRLEIIIESPALGRITDVLEDYGVAGYTVLPVLGGSGESGPWTRDGLISSAGGMVHIICIIDDSDLDPLMSKIYTVVERQIGVVNVSNCTVVRNEKFQTH